MLTSKPLPRDAGPGLHGNVADAQPRAGGGTREQQPLIDPFLPVEAQEAAGDGKRSSRTAAVPEVDPSVLLPASLAVCDSHYVCYRLSLLSVLQPFQNDVYYPYTSDTPGTHSSAEIPSLLNSPLSHCSAPAAGMTPSSGTSTFPPFKFRPRRETVNWQRINAVDINLVMSQLDVAALQDHISTVTFCSLDGERCQQCRSPVDPGLLRLLQLAQLTVEWLLHCQEFLSLNLHALEERLGGASKEHKQLLEQQSEQEQKVKALRGELELKGKAVHDLQSKLLLSSHKVQLTQRYWSPLAFHTCISITLHLPSLRLLRDPRSLIVPKIYSQLRLCAFQGRVRREKGKPTRA